MYLNINIILIILSYQCLMIYGMEKYQSNILSKAGVNDCSLSMRYKNDFKSPIPSLANTKLHPTFSSHNGRLNLKHNSLYSLTCSTGSVLSRSTVKKFKEIFVKCVNGRCKQYSGQTHDYNDFKCDDSSKRDLSGADKKHYHTNGLNDCSISIPDKNDHKTPIPSRANHRFHSHSPTHNGHLNIEQNSFFRLTCVNGKIMSRSGEKINAKEILVKCLGGYSLKYNKQTYKIKDFQCHNNRRS